MTTENQTQSEFEGWAILELMGHRKLAGYVREVTIAGAPMIRLDILDANGLPSATQYYSAAALYCMTPTTEDMARRISAGKQPQPVTRWELPEPSEATNFPDSVDDDDFN